MTLIRKGKYVTAIKGAGSSIIPGKDYLIRDIKVGHRITVNMNLENLTNYSLEEDTFIFYFGKPVLMKGLNKNVKIL